MLFQGAYSALATPFVNGEVDEESYRALIEWQIEQGIDGLVAVGTTGESATLSHDEHKRVISICLEQANKRVPVVAGSGGNDTREAIELTSFAKQAGADATLQVTPYYNKPSQEGLIEHYRAIARAAPMPMIIYNVPGRTSLNILPQTLAKLEKEVPEAVAVKEASANLKQVSEVVEFCSDKFQVLSGDDFTVLPLLSVGGIGVISVVSNIVPAMMSNMCKAYHGGDTAKAKELHLAMSPLSRAMFFETNPVPLKEALKLMGKIASDEVRLPLVNMQPDNHAKLKVVLKAAELI
ncbi:MAG: 4-hydroxy-tetrahydrodipicolinate synthase [Desulfovibrio sp.]|nr:MAG: 4-hydroxy-tetrahydrodipicolinate synthase [Desulfovibrio sp.]